MYLARQKIKGRFRFFIRESYQDEKSGLVRSRNLYDLGENPAAYIVYPGGNAFYIDEEIADRLDELGGDFSIEELEGLFWPFIKRSIRQKIEPFLKGHTIKGKARKKKAGKARSVHLFDKRRMYFIRCGVLNQCRIYRLPEALFEPVRDKSRDEIEQYFIDMESRLRPSELKEYVYVIFDLQRHFHEMVARAHPGALDPDRLETYFLDEICRLHEDETFWAGMERGKSGALHTYLARYVIMFFDYDFSAGSAMDDYWREFINSRRFYRPPAVKVKVSEEEASELFGVGKEKLKSMSKKALTRRYRKRAKELHPDVGGEHEIFLKLTEIYNAMIAGKK